MDKEDPSPSLRSGLRLNALRMTLQVGCWAQGKCWAREDVQVSVGFGGDFADAWGEV